MSSTPLVEDSLSQAGSPGAAHSGSGAASSTSAHDMAEEEAVNLLRWQDYPRSMTSRLRNLKEEEDFVDVTLACNSRQFTAHKVVLSACSPYFRQLLKVRKISLCIDVNRWIDRSLIWEGSLAICINM